MHARLLRREVLPFLVGIGAPAGAYLPPVAAALHTQIYLPEHYEVANAVGTVVGNVVVQLEGQVSFIKSRIATKEAERLSLNLERLKLAVEAAGLGELFAFREEPFEAVDDRAARVAQTEQLGDLVVGLARGVVPRPREDRDRLRREREDVRVASRDDEGREARRERTRGRPVEVEERGEGVPLDVVARDEGNAEAEGDPPPLREADEERADEAGAGRRDDETDVLEPGPRPFERLVQERREVRQVGARGDLGNDAAVAAVHVDLRRDDGRRDPAVLAEEGDGGLVAGGLEAEDEAHGRARRRASPSACGGVETPASVTMASTRAAGVTSKAG